MGTRGCAFHVERLAGRGSFSHDAEVDCDEARRVIDRQDRQARQRLQEIWSEQGSQLRAVAARIAPWLGRAWKRGMVPFPPGIELSEDNNWGHRSSSVLPFGYKGKVGHVHPDLRPVFQEAMELQDAAYGLYTRAQKWFGTRHQVLPEFPPPFTRWSFADPNTLPGLDYVYGRDYLEEKVRDLHREIERWAEELTRWAEELTEIPASEQILSVPEAHPPQYGRLNDGVLARLFSGNLDAQIRAGDLLQRSLAAGAAGHADVVAWINLVHGVLTQGLSNEVGRRFRHAAGGDGLLYAYAHAVPGVDTTALASAYLALGLAYLQEVREHMPNYAEAAGQAVPQQVSIHIDGGTFHGTQIAANIANTESIIAGVVQQGDPDLAGALKGLAEAVLAHDGLDDGQREDLLDKVDSLAEAAKSPEKRRRGMNALAALSAAATAGTELGKAMDTWGGLLHKLLS